MSSQAVDSFDKRRSDPLVMTSVTKSAAKSSCCCFAKCSSAARSSSFRSQNKSKPVSSICDIENRTACSVNSLQSSLITSAGVLDRRAEPMSKNSLAYCSRSTSHNVFNQASISRSTSVVVGDRSESVSEMIPDAMQSATLGEGVMPAPRNCRATRVQVDPTGSLINRIGCCDLRPPPMRW